MIAAFKDTRFPPIQAKELSRLTCEVSLLQHFEVIDDPLGWEVGTHGIEIEFLGPDDDERRYRGTYLPHVASEQGWDQRATMDSLLKKAGFYGGRLEEVRFVLIRRY